MILEAMNKTTDKSIKNRRYMNTLWRIENGNSTDK